MSTNEFEERDETMEKQIELVQKGVKYGVVIALAGALTCVMLMIPVYLLIGGPSGDSSGGLDFVTLTFIVSVAAPLAAIGVLGFALYKLIPLYIQYRRANRPDEDMFP